RHGFGMEQYVYLHEGDLGGRVLPLTCAWSNARTPLACTPGAPLEANTLYTIHVGGGMLDANGHVIDMDDMPMMGGQLVTAGMINGGIPSWMMGPGWQGANGTYGRTFRFTTA